MNSMDKNNTINIRLRNIFNQRFDMDLDIDSEDILHKSLLGRDIYLAPRDLLYLLDDIEKGFNIQIPQEAIAQNKFNDLYSIIKLIENQLALV